ncbi:MAG: IS3 family transposase [Betaproteobacteria bacterium]|nr:IS3 family transposase [Betaproteobacteria bacterium]MDE2122160.1 IS3 family transposase [Betaproteobacteria bacterium]MDE2185622.1 IS3 family transposase [Betaproteobacteria bacterium]MDE2323808.1 IS3 family transposase [Betaproteobacteria bacterium]
MFETLKVEWRHGQRFATRRQAEDEAIAWLLWYNQNRLQSTSASDFVIVIPAVTRKRYGALRLIANICCPRLDWFCHSASKSNESCR